jgi:hypothetical protein
MLTLELAAALPCCVPRDCDRRGRDAHRLSASAVLPREAANSRVQSLRLARVRAALWIKQKRQSISVFSFIQTGLQIRRRCNDTAVMLLLLLLLLLAK